MGTPLTSDDGRLRNHAWQQEEDNGVFSALESWMNVLVPPFPSLFRSSSASSLCFSSAASSLLSLPLCPVLYATLWMILFVIELSLVYDNAVLCCGALLLRVVGSRSFIRLSKPRFFFHAVLTPLCFLHLGVRLYSIPSFNLQHSSVESMASFRSILPPLLVIMGIFFSSIGLYDQLFSSRGRGLQANNRPLSKERCCGHSKRMNGTLGNQWRIITNGSVVRARPSQVHARDIIPVVLLCIFAVAVGSVQILSPCYWLVSTSSTIPSTLSSSSSLAYTSLNSCAEGLQLPSSWLLLIFSLLELLVASARLDGLDNIGEVLFMCGLMTTMI